MRGFATFRFAVEITVTRVSHTGMLIVMTVDTEEFPVAAIGGIIVMIVVTVVNGQLDQILRVELARAATAYPGIHLQRPAAVTLLPFFARNASL